MTHINLKTRKNLDTASTMIQRISLWLSLIFDAQNNLNNNEFHVVDYADAIKDYVDALQKAIDELERDIAA